MFTELSEALFKKCVKILKWKILTDDIEWLFDQMRQGWHVNINLEFYINFSFLFRNSSEGDLIDKILDLADLLCKNCKKHAPFKCLDSVVVTRNNWVSGARVRMSHARGRRRTNTPLGNPALYMLGDLYPDGTFSGFTISGLPLPKDRLNPRVYLYNC